MRQFLIILAFGLLAATTSVAAASEMRFALVIGNASYGTNALKTPLNDANLIAQTLEQAGFQVSSERDLSGQGQRNAFSEFTEKLRKAGPEAIALVYFVGYGLQLRGENYLLPVDAEFSAPEDVASRALRLSEQVRSLAALHLKATFLILDARANPSQLSGTPIAGGLAWISAEPDMLLAFSAAPGTTTSDARESFGVYAKALAEMIRDGGLTPSILFDRVRLRVNEMTGGAQVPWNTSNIKIPFMFFDRAPTAPARPDLPDRTNELRTQPLRNLGPTEGYFVALLRDTLDGYADFLAEYSQNPLANRVQALTAARREAITWARAYQANVAEAYWTYLERYPQGPHATDARSLLGRLGTSITLPSKFRKFEYDVPAPMPDELPYVGRAVLKLDDPEFGFASPPPLPAHFLGPPPAELAGLKTAEAALGAIAPLAPLLAPARYAIVPDGVVLPTNPLASWNGGLLVRGSVDTPVVQPDRFRVPAIAKFNEADMPAKAQPEPVSPVGEAREQPAPSQSSDLSPTKQQPIEQSASIRQMLATPGTGERSADAPAAIPSTFGSPPLARDNGQRMFGPVPLPRPRPATLKRLVSRTMRAPGVAQSQTVVPQVTGSASLPNSSAPASSNGQLNPTARKPPALSRPPQQARSTRQKSAAVPKIVAPDRPAAPPPDLADKACMNADGKLQPCN
jgi:uncharacterized caspase-like protein